MTNDLFGGATVEDVRLEDQIRAVSEAIERHRDARWFADTGWTTRGDEMHALALAAARRTLEGVADDGS